MNIFNLENQYQLYLQRMGMNEHAMHEVQKKQLRQTFMAACGQLLLLLRDDFGELDDMTACDTLQDMLNQVSNFFLTETNKVN